MNIDSLFEPLPELSDSPKKTLRDHWDQRAKPPGSLGDIEDLVVRYGHIHGEHPPPPVRGFSVTFCGDHGVTEEGVSPYSRTITSRMIEVMRHGEAAASILADSLPCSYHVVDAGTDRSPDQMNEASRSTHIGSGTGNIRREPAMTHDQMRSALQLGKKWGKKAVHENRTVVVPGDLGIGNTTSSAALTVALTGCDPVEVVGTGSGLPESKLEHKRTVVREAVQRAGPEGETPYGALRHLGGFEIAAIAGFIRTAAANQLPIIMDGFIVSSAALIASQISGKELSPFLIFGHRSGVRGHAVILDVLESDGSEPCLDLNMRLGEGTGALFALSLLQKGVRLFRELPDMQSLQQPHSGKE